MIPIEFTGKLKFQVTSDSKTYTLNDAQITAASGNPAECPSADAITFVSHVCQFNLNLEGASTGNVPVVPGDDLVALSAGTALLAEDLTLSGGADLSGGMDNNALRIEGHALTVQSALESNQSLRIPAGTTLNAVAGTWSGVINPPVVLGVDSLAQSALSGVAPTLTVQMGDENARLDLGASPAEVQVVLENTTCNPNGYNVVRKSYGELSYSNVGITNVSTTQSGDDCWVTFKTRYMSKFAVAQVASTSTPTTGGGSSSGGGGGGSTPDTTTPYQLGTASSDKIVALHRPLDLGKTNGFISRPVELTDYYHGYQVEIPQGIQVKLEDGTDFSGIITVPSSVARADRPATPADFTRLKTISVGDQDGQKLIFSQAFILKIPLALKDDQDASKVKIYFYNEEEQKYEMVGTGGTVTEDGDFISVQSDHMSVFSVLYEGETEAGEDVADIETNSLSNFLFNDIQNHWSKNYIEELAQKGIVKNQIKFRPNEALNRAELIKMVVVANFDQETIEACLGNEMKQNFTYTFFPDVDQNAWYAPYVCVAKVEGIIEGYRDGTFKPAQAVNRAEGLKMVLAADGEKNFTERNSGFSDVKSSDWFAPYVTYASENQIVQGVGQGRFAPADLLMRGQMAKILALVLELN